MPTQPPAYRSYVLRLWEEHSEEPALAVWRCSLEDPLTGARRGFATLDGLVAWLKTELTPPGTAPAAPTGAV